MFVDLSSIQARSTRWSHKSIFSGFLISSRKKATMVPFLESDWRRHFDEWTWCRSRGLRKKRNLHLTNWVKKPFHAFWLRCQKLKSLNRAEVWVQSKIKVSSMATFQLGNTAKVVHWSKMSYRGPRNLPYDVKAFTI